MALEAGEIDELRGVLWLSKVYEPTASLVAGRDAAADDGPAADVSAALEILVDNEVDVSSIEHFRPEDFDELAVSISVQRVGLPRYAEHAAKQELLELIDFLCASGVSNLLQHLRQCVDDEMDVETFSHFTTEDFEESGIQLGDRLKIRAELKARGFSAAQTSNAVIGAAPARSSPVTPVRDALPSSDLHVAGAQALGADQHSRGLNVDEQRRDAPSSTRDTDAEASACPAVQPPVDPPPRGGRQVGTIKWYEEAKRFGFLRPDSHEKDIFIHKADVALLPPNVDRSALKGLRVGFETSLRDGREVAVNLALLEMPPTQMGATRPSATHRSEAAAPWKPLLSAPAAVPADWIAPNVGAAHQAATDTRTGVQSPAVSLLWHGVGSSCTCPISGNPLVDPVMAPDGVTYERASIEAWLSNGNTYSPVDRKVAMASSDLIPNVSMLRLITSTAEVLDGMKDEIQTNEAQLRMQMSAVQEAETAHTTESTVQEQRLQTALQQNATLAEVAARNAATVVARDKELFDAKRTIAELKSRLAGVEGLLATKISDLTVAQASLAAAQAQAQARSQGMQPQMQQQSAVSNAVDLSQISEVDGRSRAKHITNADGTPILEGDAGGSGGLMTSMTGLGAVHPATQQLVSTLDGLLAEASAAQVARAAALVRAELQGTGTQHTQHDDKAACEDGTEKARKAERSARKTEYLESIRVAIHLNADFEVYSHKYSKWLQGKVVSLSGNEAKVEYCGRTKRVNISDYGSLRLADAWVQATGHHVPDMTGGIVLGEGEGILRHVVHS